MIKVTDLNKAFGALRAVHELSFEAAPRRITSIIGPNGAGKSTAFNLIAGTLRPDAGRVELDGRDVTGEPSYQLARLRSEEHTSELQSLRHLVCRLLLEKK